MDAKKDKVGGILYLCEMCGMEEMVWDFAKEKVVVELITCSACDESVEEVSK